MSLFTSTLSLYRHMAIGLHGASHRFVHSALDLPSFRAGIAALLLMGFPMGARAAGIVDLMTGWSAGIKGGIDLVILAFLLIGIVGVGYGCKLIMDKSNDRADVKTSHIVVSLVGGSLLCMLWVVIQIMVETSGGSSSDIGRAATY